MKLAVVGSRTFNDYERLKEELDKIENIELIITGGALGADFLASKYAKENNILEKLYLPYWQNFGKSAGMLRNSLIVDNCDYLIAFWDGKSKGTKDSINKAKKQGKLLRIVYV